MKVSWESGTDTDLFKERYGDEFNAWIKIAANQTHTTATGKKHVFNKANVRNGLHSTTSKQDPDPTDHVTIRLSNAELDGKKEWFVLHWRPKAKGGNCVILSKPSSEEEGAMKAAKARDKKLKHRAKKEEEKKQQEAEDAKKKAAEDAKKKAVADAKKKAVEDAKNKAAEDAKKKDDKKKDKGGGSGAGGATPAPKVKVAKK